ncbi:hypothetical protein N431DRAFT_438855 [Stipitochalara longipes BDJ]|nr:hypothetical protein N431DRAFT_438855 [Stipitochalara longipes BDJ]
MADQPNQLPAFDEVEPNGGPSAARGSEESTTEPQAEAISSSSPPANKCASCSAPETDPENPLKPCAKCQTIRYCSRDCQKKDWKLHKKVCATAAQIYAQNANLKPAAPRAPKKEGHRGGLQKWQFDT